MTTWQPIPWERIDRALRDAVLYAPKERPRLMRINRRDLEARVRELELERDNLGDLVEILTARLARTDTELAEEKARRWQGELRRGEGTGKG